MSTPSHPRKQFVPLIIAFALIALLFGMWTQHNNNANPKAAELESGTILPQAHDIKPFNLVGMDNKPFTNQNLKNKWSMLFFGFTNCPQLCPTTLSTLNTMYTQMEKDKVSTLPQIVFISLDPDRDDSEEIREYLKSFNRHFVGATGKQEDLDRLTKEMNVVYEKVKNPHKKKQGDYLINHSGTLLVVNPEGKLHAIFSTPHDAKKLSHDLQAIEKRFN